MVRSPHEGNEKEDLKVRFAWLAHRIDALKNIVTQLLVMNGKDANTMMGSSSLNSSFKTLPQEAFRDFEKHTRGIDSS